MDIQQVEALLEQTTAAFNELKSAQNESTRIHAQEQALKLARSLERPRDAILKLAYTVIHSKFNKAISMEALIYPAGDCNGRESSPRHEGFPCACRGNYASTFGQAGSRKTSGPHFGRWVKCPDNPIVAF